MGTIGIEIGMEMGKWGRLHPIPPLIYRFDTDLGLRPPPSCVLVHASSRHGDGRVCGPDTRRYAQDGEPGILASGQGSNYSMEMFARRLFGCNRISFTFLYYISALPEQASDIPFRIV